MMNEVYRRGDDIVCQGDQASSYYLIKEGEVNVIINNKKVNVLKQGGTFGESALYKDTTRGGTCRARSKKVVCLSIGRETLTKILGESIHIAFQHNVMRWAINKNKYLSQLTQIQKQQIINLSEIKEYEEEMKLVDQDTPCNQYLWICIKGGLENVFFNIKFKIEQLSGKQLCQKEEVFGSQYLKRQRKNDKHQESI